MGGPRDGDAGALEPNLSPGAEIDGFVLKRLVGVGPTGWAYLAHDLKLGRPVRLKVLRSAVGRTATERFLEVARAAARFNHPNLLTLYRAGSFQGWPYLALESLGGPTLRERLSDGPIGVREALRLAQGIAEGMAEAHRRGVLHDDLRAEHVIVPPDGRPRVIDFGLAHLVDRRGGADEPRPAGVAPERWRGSAPTTAGDVWAFGVLLHELVVGAPPATSRASRSSVAPDELWEILDACLEEAPELRPSAEGVAQRLARLCAPEEPRGAGRSPFRGLEAFGEDDAGDFFGREAEIAACVEALRTAPVLPLVGPSGVGKSSFVLAGLLPRLREAGPWALLPVRLSRRPLASLAQALGDASLAAVLSEAPGATARRLGVLHRLSGQRLLLFFDQFEELFTLAPPEEVAALCRCVAAAGLEPGDPWRVVIALRDDFLGPLSRVKELAGSLGATVVLGPIGRVELEKAITEPLRRLGYRLESDALASRISLELDGRPAALPLVQFALMALWERRDRERHLLTVAEYEAVGGASGALAAHAERMVAGMSALDVRRLRALLLALVNLPRTRRPRTRRELLERDEGGAAVLDELVRHRLVVVRREAETDEALLELAHESLAITWPRLQRWLEETREERALVEQLEQAAAPWTKRGEPEAETWSGAALTEALHRLEQWGTVTSAPVERFLASGRRRRAASLRRYRRGLLGILAALGTVAGAATLVALEFREGARVAVAQQEQIRLAAADVGLFELALQAFDFDPGLLQVRAASREVRQGLRITLYAPDERDAARPGRVLEPVEVRPVSGASEGAAVFRVEAPAGPAFLEVAGRGEGCSASWLFLQRLPGYTERRGPAPPRLELSVPTCAASRSTLVAVPGEPALFIDRTEVSNAAFAPFEALRGLTGASHLVASAPAVLAEARGPSYPVTGVDARTAEAYCRYLGKRLPSVQEWRRAASPVGPGASAGRPRSATRANLAGGADGFEGVAPVGAGDESPAGVFDLKGNVSEWTLSPVDDAVPDGLRIIAGGNWADAPLALSGEQPPGYADFALGVRCAAP